MVDVLIECRCMKCGWVWVPDKRTRSKRGPKKCPNCMQGWRTGYRYRRYWGVPHAAQGRRLTQGDNYTPKPRGEHLKKCKSEREKARVGG